MSKFINFSVVFLSILFLNSCESKKEAAKVESKFYTDSIYSNHLSEYRKHNIYLPQDFDASKNYPIIYATDGGKIKGKNPYTIAIDSLINNNIIKPVILITSFCNTKVADSTIMTTGDGKAVTLNYRNFEYIDVYNSESENPDLQNRFKNHMRYFKDELIPQVEKKINQNLKKSERYFYGVSNGAGFGMSLLNTHPDVIGTYLCFSTFGGNIQTSIWDANTKYPDLYLNYGNKEPEFLKMDADFLKEKYKELGLFADISAFDGGHDFKKWNEAYINVISKILKTEE